MRRVESVVPTSTFAMIHYLINAESDFFKATTPKGLLVQMAVQYPMQMEQIPVQNPVQPPTCKDSQLNWPILWRSGRYFPPSFAGQFWRS